MPHAVNNKLKICGLIVTPVSKHTNTFALILVSLEIGVTLVFVCLCRTLYFTCCWL